MDNFHHNKQDELQYWTPLRFRPIFRSCPIPHSFLTLQWHRSLMPSYTSMLFFLDALLDVIFFLDALLSYPFDAVPPF
jgi:hypothetical protein